MHRIELDPQPAATIVVFQPFYPPAILGGGPIRTVSALVDAASAPERIYVLTSDRDLGQRERLNVQRNHWTNQPSRAHVYYVSDDSISKYLRALRDVRRKRPGIVYFNSVFSVKYAIIPLFARLIGVWRGATLIIAPRGELSPRALSVRARKKSLYLSAFRLAQFHERVTWHASSEREASDIRRVFGTNATIVVREDETALPEDPTIPIERHHESLRLIFVGRIAPIKGLDVLLTALREVALDVRLDIFGGTEDLEYGAKCHAIAAGVPPNITIRFQGPIPHSEVVASFASSDAFAFPTESENFAHVIAESLSASCPVLVADVTPWSATIEEGGGVLVRDTSPRGWAQVIDDLASEGVSGWFNRRIKAAGAYVQWRSEDRGPNIFDLVAAKTCDSDRSAP